MIIIDNIKKTYNNQVVLDIDKLSLEEGKIYIVIGSNGSGKSTLAKILSGLLLDDSGKKLKLVSSTNPNKVLNIGYIPQKPYIFDMSMEKNIMINGNDLSKCNELISKFGISYLKGKNAKKLSGGEQQKMGLARFMMKDYDLAILDEPTSAMDNISRNNALEIIKEYAKNKTLIMITHDLDALDNINGQIIKLDCGKIVC